MNVEASGRSTMGRRGRFLVLAALSGALTVATSAPAGADTISVTTTADVTDPGDGLTSLREAIAQANGNGVGDVIELTAATHTLSDCGAGEILYDEAQDLTINGNGATIAQTCPDQRILDKAGSNTTTLTVNDVTVVNTVNTGIDIDGAAFRAQSALVLNGVTIDGVDAGFGGSLVAFDFGPAVFDLELQDVVITNNTGRGVDNLNPAGVLVNGSTISNNTGSGISLGDGTPLTVTNSIIQGNGGHGISTSGQGFGIQPVVTITESTIADNDLGGFLCLTSCRTLEVANSMITGNGLSPLPGGGGGLVMAIFTDGGSPLQSVSIADSVISGNHADHDGAGLLTGASFEISGPDSPTTTITGSTITNNTASCSDCDGGGVAVQVGDLSIVDSDISANTAGGNGGGVSHRRVSYDVITSTTSFVLSGSSVTGNGAGASGGGVWAHSSTQTIDTSEISGNTAGNVGGGLEVGGSVTDVLFESGVATVESSTLTGNTALFGGAVGVGFPDGSSVALTNVTVDANSASSAGGALALGPTESATLDHVTATANSAPVGATLAASGSTTVRASVLDDPLGGGLHCEPFPFGPFPLGVTSGGFSWLDDASCTSGPDDVVTIGGDPQLGPLADNGGPTTTRLPEPGSPLISQIAPADCLVAVDQRGEVRPQGTGCEPGAVEVAVAPIMGTEGNDRLLGTDDADVVLGLGGNDRLWGLGADDLLDGGPGRDRLDGGGGTNQLIGGLGRDTLTTRGVGDVADGGPGRDRLVDRVGGNTLLGGPGRDVLITFGPGSTLDGGPGRDLCIIVGEGAYRC